MDALIDLYTTEETGLIEDVFSAHVATKIRWFPKGWGDMDVEIDDMKMEVAELASHGARLLLLLLAYIMTKNVLDDKSNEFQM